MAEVILITGGARSGKSAQALHLAEPYEMQIFIATAELIDDEMHERIVLHQAERGDGWQTIEAPVALAEAIERITDPKAVIIVDCLTTWIGNLMHRDLLTAEASPAFDALLRALRHAAAHRIILVTNEVGMGIIPDNAMARSFRDIAGRLNQHVAAIADRVLLTVCGQTIDMKNVANIRP